MVDGIGTTTYGYHAAGQAGAGQVASVDGPWTDDTITYTYDQLGRVTTRAINGVGVTWAFDALGRITSEDGRGPGEPTGLNINNICKRRR